MSKPTPHHFFPAGEDLPLFTGQPLTTVERPCRALPQESWIQVEISLYRTTQPELFYPQRDAFNNLTGPVVELPAGTLVRVVQVSSRCPTKQLVATASEADDLFAWTWTDHLEPI